MLVFLPLVEQLTGIESNNNILIIKSSSKFARAFFIITTFTSNLFLKKSYLKTPLITYH